MILIFGTCFHGNVCMIHRPVKVEYKLTRRLDTSYHIHFDSLSRHRSDHDNHVAIKVFVRLDYQPLFGKKTPEIEPKYLSDYNPE